MGLGSVNGRYFLFHVGIGFDAAVVGQVERRGALKRYAGHPLFVYAALDTWLRHYDRKRPRFAVPPRPTADRSSTTATSPSASTPTPTRTSATGPSTWPPTPGSTAASSW